MLLIAKFLAKILSTLNSEVSPRQIAAGFAFGALIGLLPIKGLLPTLFLLIAFLININLTMVFVGAALFKLLAFGVDPLAHSLGLFSLTKISSLHPFLTKLYNTPLIPFTRFNNTLVMGSFLIGLFLLIPLYLAGQKGVVSYRRVWREKVEQWKIMKMLKASSFYKFYLTFQEFRGQ